MKPLWLLAAAIALSGCGQTDTQDEAATNAPDAADSAPRPAAPYPDAALVLTPDGISVKGGTPIRFGDERSAVDRFAASALAMPGTPSRNAECGAGPTDFSTYGPLQLLFQDGRFVGWYLTEAGEGSSEAAPRIVTVDGIAPGISMEALGAERQLRPIVDSTLEGEFEYLSATGGMITGFYRGDARRGTVSSLASGQTCFFR